MSKPKKNTAQTGTASIAPPPLPTMRVEMMDLDRCVEMKHPRNPKEHNVDALVDSFVRFGFVAPPTIDEATMTMVAGHGRCEALVKMRAANSKSPSNIIVQDDRWFVPVYRGVAFRSARERDAYVVADNQHVISGGWNMDALADLLRDFRDTDEGFGGIGFDDLDLRSLGVAAQEFVEDTGKKDDDANEPETDVRGHRRKIAAGNDLVYKLVITCTDEAQQAELLERLEAEGLDVSPMIS